MDIDRARQAKHTIDESKHESLRKGLYASAIRYAQCRAEWKLLSVKERVGRDAARTVAHDAFIDACNIMSRNMAKAYEPAEWRARLGNDRKTIGDFACYLHCLLAIEAR